MSVVLYSPMAGRILNWMIRDGVLPDECWATARQSWLRIKRYSVRQMCSSDEI